MRRIRVLVVLAGLVCAVIGGASPATVSAAGAAAQAPMLAAPQANQSGKRWGRP